LRAELEFIVDAGVIYTVIPKSVAEGLRLRETGRRKFKIADGDVVEYPVSEAYIIINGEGVTSLVAIAEEKISVLLGGTILELLGQKLT
jgi:predicted aspartyl protease